jgi:chromosome partitioning protein
MVITVASYKGGVGKSTTAVHVAAYLQEKAPTVLVDSDPNRSVCGWAASGRLPFEVIPLHQAARRTRDFDHVVVDTNAGLRPDEIKEIVEGCDLLVIPTTPDALSYQSLMITVGHISKIERAQYKALLTIIRRGRLEMATRCERSSRAKELSVYPTIHALRKRGPTTCRLERRSCREHQTC